MGDGTEPMDEIEDESGILSAEEHREYCEWLDYIDGLKTKERNNASAHRDESR